MAAYAAVTSLRNTVEHIASNPRFRLVHPSAEILEAACKELQPLQDVLEKLDITSKSRSRNKVNALDLLIKDTLWDFEDLLESLVSNQLMMWQLESPSTMSPDTIWDFKDLSQSLVSNQIIKPEPEPFVFGQFRRDQPESIHSRRRRKRAEKWKVQVSNQFPDSKDLFESLVSNSVPLDVQSLKDDDDDVDNFVQKQLTVTFSIDVRSLKDDVDNFVQKLKDMKKEFIHELDNLPQDEDEESGSGGVGSIVTKKKESRMIRLSDQLEEIKRYLLRKHCRNHVYALVGMGGLGKTTLANQIFEDPSIFTHFDSRVWVTVGRKSNSNQLARAILAQLDPPPPPPPPPIPNGDAEEFYYSILKERLDGKNCLIVLDDVWEIEVLHPFLKSLTYKANGITQMLLTARAQTIVRSIESSSYICGSRCIVVQFLNEEESKDLLWEKVFGGKICPPQLLKAATKIAKNCEGLPLLIVTVAGILAEAQSSDPKYWDDVAEKRNSVFNDAYNEVSKVLFPSYDYLPQYLKMFFLYLGVFPPDYVIPSSKIINMLTAEGWFDGKSKLESLEYYVFKCLDELYRLQNLILLEEKNIYRLNGSISICKTCSLHSAWRHLCRAEARKIKFFHVLNKLVDASEDVMIRQRCLCLENNILFGIKEFCSSVKCFCASSMRSLLFFGPYHRYPTTIGVDFKLLRELDALKLRFYSFPIEILTLSLLKYLALTCNGELPTTISKLFNLRVLIVHPHSNIKYSSRAPSCIPIQIWEMQELEHIEILGKSLVAPRHVAPNLEKLVTLLGVNSSISSIIKLYEKTPRIRKIGFQIELTPSDNHGDLMSCFHCTSKLETLKTLKCSIINPVLRPSIPGFLMFPQGLKKLHLSGTGFPWEYMNVVAFLPYLQALRFLAF